MIPIKLPKPPLVLPVKLNKVLFGRNKLHVFHGKIPSHPLSYAKTVVRTISGRKKPAVFFLAKDKNEVRALHAQKSPKMEGPEEVEILPDALPRILPAGLKKYLASVEQQMNEADLEGNTAIDIWASARQREAIRGAGYRVKDLGRNPPSGPQDIYGPKLVEVSRKK